MLASVPQQASSSASANGGHCTERNEIAPLASRGPAKADGPGERRGEHRSAEMVGCSRAAYVCQPNMRRINTSGSSLIALAINTISPSSVLR